MHGVKWTSWKGCSSNTYTARTNIRPKTAAGLLWWKVWDALLLPINVVKWTPPQPNASPEYLSFNMCPCLSFFMPSYCKSVSFFRQWNTCVKPRHMSKRALLCRRSAGKPPLLSLLVLAALLSLPPPHYLPLWALLPSPPCLFMVTGGAFHSRCVM